MKKFFARLIYNFFMACVILAVCFVFILLLIAFWQAILILTALSLIWDYGMDYFRAREFKSRVIKD